MSARESILRAVREAKPGAVPLPALPTVSRDTENLIERFSMAVRASGADIMDVTREELAGLLEKVAAGAIVRESSLGVAENGSVWLPLSKLGRRAEFFLADHVVVVLDRSTIVPDMHAAYARVDVSAESFGVFVSGPSKTADIEQSLVIGAQGPKRMTIVMLPS